MCITIKLFELVLLCLCPGAPDPGSILETLLLVHPRFTELIIFQMKYFRLNRSTVFEKSLFC